MAYYGVIKQHILVLYKAYYGVIKQHLLVLYKAYDVVFNTTRPYQTSPPWQLLGDLALQADVWSFGCTALESSTALPPWGKGAIDGMLSAVKRGSPRGTHGEPTAVSMVVGSLGEIMGY